MYSLNARLGESIAGADAVKHSTLCWFESFVWLTSSLHLLITAAASVKAISSAGLYCTALSGASVVVEVAAESPPLDSSSEEREREKEKGGCV